jgi:seryl-tRNA synthetase
MNLETMMNLNTISCPFCLKEYSSKKKKELDKHALICEFLSNKNTKEDEDIENIPSPLKMYKMIKELVLQNKKLQDKVNDLEKMIQKGPVKKIDILISLNSNVEKPKYTYKEWLSQLTIQEEDINNLISENISNVSNIILSRYIEECGKENIPIMSSDQKKNIIYIYNIPTEMDNSSPGTSPTTTSFMESEPRWIKIGSDDFMLLIKTLYQYLLRVLNFKWKETYKHINHFDDIECKIMQKITNINIENYNDVNNRKIFNNLYNCVLK